jgi:hypothetical protein
MSVWDKAVGNIIHRWDMEENGKKLFQNAFKNVAHFVSKRGAGVAQSVHCLTTAWTAVVRSLTEAEGFSSTLCVQAGSGAHPASCTVGTGGSFPGGKARPGRDAGHSPTSSAEVKKE